MSGYRSRTQQHLSLIADAAAAALAAESSRLDAEQAVRGIDALDELALHPVLARGFAGAGFGVSCEVRYPAARGRRNRSQGDRCDLVLTPDGRELAAPDCEPTLFDAPDPVALHDAFWLEVKVVGQHGEGGPNSGYSPELIAAVAGDAAKLARDPGIRHAGVLVVLFAADAPVAEHDLGAALGRAVGAGLPLGPPCRRLVPINDRLGNTVAATSLFPLIAR